MKLFLPRHSLFIIGMLLGFIQPGSAQGLRDQLIRQNQQWLNVHAGPSGAPNVIVPSTGKAQRSASFNMRDKPNFGDLASMNVTVRWTYGKKADPDDMLPLTVEIQEGGKTVLTKKFDDGEAMFGAVQIVRLDASTKSPQVLILTNGGGTINFSALDIATSSADGSKWSWLKTECCNGDPEYRLITENIPGEEVGMIIDIQMISLERFSNAARWGTASYQVSRIERGKLIDVTADMEFQGVHKRRLAEWFRENDEYLKRKGRPVTDERWIAAAIGYVSTKARLGEFPEAWNTFITDFGFGRDRKLQAEVKSALVAAKIITAQMASATSSGPQSALSIKVTDTMMGGGIKEIDLTLSDQGRKRTIRGVLVNCGKSGIPQVVVRDRRWTINSDNGSIQDGPKGFPAGDVWIATCR